LVFTKFLWAFSDATLVDILKAIIILLAWLILLDSCLPLAFECVMHSLFYKWFFGESKEPHREIVILEQEFKSRFPVLFWMIQETLTRSSESCEYSLAFASLKLETATMNRAVSRRKQKTFVQVPTDYLPGRREPNSAPVS
jgi:hypothetical protein